MKSHCCRGTCDADSPGMPNLCLAVDGREAVEAAMVGGGVSDEDGAEVPSLVEDTVGLIVQNFLTVEPTDIW